MDGFHLVLLNKGSSVECLVHRLEQELEKGLKSFRVVHEDVEIPHAQKLSTILPYRNKEVFPVICRVDLERNVIELHADVEIQAFIYEENDKPASFWTLNREFYKSEDVVKFPAECANWSRPQVDFWFQWAVGHFKLSQKDSLNIWDCDGRELCCADPNVFETETFRTHLKILCEFNFVCSPIQCLDINVKRYTKALSVFRNLKTVRRPSTALWEFLLKLLVDRKYKEIIEWRDNEGTFEVLNCETIAEMWGTLNKNPQCSYESIHTAITKGTCKDYIVHVPSENYTYKYVIDIHEVVGISPMLINQLRQSTS